jgi:mono/diheme cytochrome c family protein
MKGEGRRMLRGTRAELCRRGRRLASFILHLSSFIAVGCNTGTYPTDIFPEMHYQPSYRPLEPERRSPPEGAVPITGAAPRLTFEQAAGVPNPVARTAESLARGRELFRVNCAVCHGQDGRGQGAVAPYYGRGPAAPVPPADLASARVRARTDGQLWWIVRRGLGNMPPFGDLLTDDEVWTVVRFIREVQGS